ncbi:MULTISPECIES: MATE family efflux transporter [Hyphomonas]|nr:MULTISPECIES: MATE family efflux transporter [Hyphomonas]MBB40714.1 MATE family efflux transporter [Hyphomonas sp.]
MSLRPSPDNRFLHLPPGRVFVANALPMMLIMLMNGLLNIIDAAFLGHFVGTGAMTAIGLVFPAIMVLIALSTLVSGGMSSLLARQLGAGDTDSAGATLASAHGLAIAISAIVMIAFLCGGRAVADQLSASDPVIAGMAFTYMAITVLALPVQFALGLHADTWRNEGRAGLVALLSVGVTLANILLNYVLIGELGLGVAGSAWGTALAQVFGLGLLLWLRGRGQGAIPLLALRRYRWTGGWGRLAGLGAPLSLSFIGMAVVSACVIVSLRLTAGADYADTIAAYGIVTRILGFAYLPSMAFALALQSIVGNNWGAGLYDRVRSVLHIAMGTAFVYSLGMEGLFLTGGHAIGAAFIGDAGVIARVAGILRLMAVFYLFTGPVLALAMYFQSIGQPQKAAVLTLSKAFVLLPVLIAALAATRGAGAVWFAFPLSDGVMAFVAAAIFITALKQQPDRPQPDFAE